MRPWICNHRIGQTRPAQTYAYLCPDTVEQRIAEILTRKRALFADLLDDVAVSTLRRLDLPTLLEAVGMTAGTNQKAFWYA